MTSDQWTLVLLAVFAPACAVAIVLFVRLGFSGMALARGVVVGGTVGLAAVWAARVTPAATDPHGHCDGPIFLVLMPLVVWPAVLSVFWRWSHEQRPPARPVGRDRFALGFAALTLFHSGWTLLSTPARIGGRHRMNELELAQLALMESTLPLFLAISALLFVLFFSSKWRRVRLAAELTLLAYFACSVRASLLVAHYRSFMADSCGG